MISGPHNLSLILTSRVFIVRKMLSYLADICDAVLCLYSGRSRVRAVQSNHEISWRWCSRWCWRWRTSQLTSDATQYLDSLKSLKEKNKQEWSQQETNLDKLFSSIFGCSQFQFWMWSKNMIVTAIVLDWTSQVNLSSSDWTLTNGLVHVILIFISKGNIKHFTNILNTVSLQSSQ